MIKDKIKKILAKARKSFTVYSASIIAICGVIQSNIAAFDLTPQEQGRMLIIIGIIVTLARLRPKGGN